MNCYVCGRPRWSWRRLRAIKHTACWERVGAWPYLVSEQGKKYLRIDPVPLPTPEDYVRPVPHS